MMEYKEFKEALFKEAIAKGCEAAEAYYVRGEAFSVNVLKGEMEQYEVNRGNGLNLRVSLGGKDGYAYTEALADPEGLVARAMDNARAIENEDDHPMQGKSTYPKLERPERKCDSLTEREKIELAGKLEKAMLAADKRVERAMYSAVESDSREIFISNTLGLDAHGERRSVDCLAMPVTREGDDVRNKFSFRVGDEIFDYETCAKEAVAETVALHGAAPVSAGKYKVLIRNDAMGDMLSAFSSMFSAEAAQKGLSLLKDKTGESIASSSISIIDDPLMADNPREFDDEGVPSVKTTVVENGVLRSFLHNLKTAKKAGVPSTSNGGRAGVASPVDIMPSNFYIAAGSASFEEMVNELCDGLIITDVSGLHAGLNPVSGEFSLIAQGRLVSGGKIVRPVDQITVAGSFMELMQSVETVGSDLRFGPSGGARIGSPSLLIKELTISGK